MSLVKVIDTFEFNWTIDARCVRNKDSAWGVLDPCLGIGVPPGV